MCFTSTYVCGVLYVQIKCDMNGMCVCVCMCVCVLCVCVCVVCGTNGVFSQKGIHTCQSSSSNLRIH